MIVRARVTYTLKKSPTLYWKKKKKKKSILKYGRDASKFLLSSDTYINLT